MAVGALAVACGGDDDDDGKTGGTTTTGTPTTGTPTTGATTTGSGTTNTNNNTGSGTTNTTSSGGSGGTGGGTGGSAGDTGIGGAGGEAGMNGEGGGAGAPMYADYCHDQCDAQAAADCANYDEMACLDGCQQGADTYPQCETEYEAYMQCMAAQTWTCDGTGQPDPASPTSACILELSTWGACLPV